MEVITAEEFRGQPVETQGVFMDWWCWENGYISDNDLVQDENQITSHKDDPIEPRNGFALWVRRVEEATPAEEYKDWLTYF